MRFSLKSCIWLMEAPFINLPYGDDVEQAEAARQDCVPTRGDPLSTDFESAAMRPEPPPSRSSHS